MVFEDEASFYRQPSVAPLYAPQGRAQPRCRLCARSNGCVRAAVAFDPASGRSMHLMRSRFTVSAMAAVYRAIGAWAAGARQVFVVMDNWPVHRHPSAWRGLEEDSRLRALWLPTYSPWLNPAEKVWKWVRQRRCHMHGHSHDLGGLRQSISRALDQASQCPQEMLRYTGTGGCKLYGT